MLIYLINVPGLYNDKQAADPLEIQMSNMSKNSTPDSEKTRTQTVLHTIQAQTVLEKLAVSDFRYFGRLLGRIKNGIIMLRTRIMDAAPVLPSTRIFQNLELSNLVQ